MKDAALAVVVDSSPDRPLSITERDLLLLLAHAHRALDKRGDRQAPSFASTFLELQ